MLHSYFWHKSICMDYQEFFIETGRLLYAVAMADGEVQPDEQSRILEIIRQNLKELEHSHDAFGTANAFYTEFEVERLIDFRVEPREAFASFIDFVHENNDEITADIRSQIIKMAENVADSYHGIDNSEAELMLRLRKALKVD